MVESKTKLDTCCVTHVINSIDFIASINTMYSTNGSGQNASLPYLEAPKNMDHEMPIQVLSHQKRILGIPCDLNIKL